MLWVINIYIYIRESFRRNGRFCEPCIQTRIHIDFQNRRFVSLLYRRFILYAAFCFVSSHSLSSFLVCTVQPYILIMTCIKYIICIQHSYVRYVIIHRAFVRHQSSILYFLSTGRAQWFVKKIALRHSWWLRAFEIDSFSVKDQISMWWNTWKKVYN